VNVGPIALSLQIPPAVKSNTQSAFPCRRAAHRNPPPTLCPPPKKNKGFDNGITGGVIAHPDFGPKFFPSMAHGPEKPDAFCKYDDHLLQLFTSSLFLSAAVAAMVGTWTCNRFGRKATMLVGGLAFLIGTGLVAGAVATPMLVVGRIVLGVGVGFACQVRGGWREGAGGGLGFADVKLAAAVQRPERLGMPAPSSATDSPTPSPLAAQRTARPPPSTCPRWPPTTRAGPSM
jgi:hypothetical protein